MSIVYTRYMQVYSIRGKICICMSMMQLHTMAIYRCSQFVVVTLTASKSSRTPGNTFANIDIMVSDLQTDTAALKSKNAWVGATDLWHLTTITHERVHP